MEQSIREQRIRRITSLYYSKPEVQKAIFEFSKNRETIPRYFEGFGKRPDSFEYPGDSFELVKKGATSFHCSEEIWKDPMKINTEMSKEQANDLRTGWDLLIDIDSKYLDYSKIMAELIIKMLKFHGIKNIGIKFSVSGDTPVLVDDGRDFILTSIFEAIKLIKKGKKLKILSLDKNKKLKFSKVYDFLEHKDTIYEIINSQSTLPIKATGHHSVFIWDKGDIIQRKVTELKKGNFLISYHSKENPFSVKNLEIHNEFEFGTNQFKKKTIKRKLKVTNELMRLIGYFLAEGHVTNIINQVGFTFNKNEVDYIEDVRNLLYLITKRKISIRNPNPNSTQILIHSKEWATFFDNFCGKKKDKHVPSFTFKASRELFLELLRGYIRGDGYKIGEHGIVVKSVSKKLITEMVWLCELNGISCNFSKEYNKEHRLPQGTLFKGGRVYLLRIPKSELESLEFHRKRNKFSPYAGSKIFPIDGLKYVYGQIKPKMFNSHRAEQMTLSKKRANLNRIRKVLDWFYKFKSIEPDKKAKNILFNYEQLFDSDMSVVEIKEIQKKNKVLVYDVSVEETEAFFGNYYPVLLHNSGSKGFHIIIPWKAFPKEINNVQAKNKFPEWPRIITRYIMDRTREELTQRINDLRYKDIYGSISKYIKRDDGSRNVFDITPEIKLSGSAALKIRYDLEGIGKDEKSYNKEVIPDLVLVSPRHLFRAPYSLHEKTALASVVLDIEEIQNFDMKDADPMKAKIKNFIPNVEEGEAKELLVQALDWHKDNNPEEEEKEKRKDGDFKTIKISNLSEDNLPPCIKKILSGLSDGRQRSVFVLISLFRSIGMDRDELEKRIYDWNEKNTPPLKSGIIKNQLTVAYKGKPLMSPNCKEYYQGIGVCAPDNFCRLIKNPVNYIVKKTFNSTKKESNTKKK